MDDLRIACQKLQEEFEFIKHEVRRKDRHLFEQWKAGGFIIDVGIVSMYPNLETVVETLDAAEPETKSRASHD
jgi:hypothetical protein